MSQFSGEKCYCRKINESICGYFAKRSDQFSQTRREYWFARKCGWVTWRQRKKNIESFSQVLFWFIEPLRFFEVFKLIFVADRDERKNVWSRGYVSTRMNHFWWMNPDNFRNSGTWWFHVKNFVRKKWRMVTLVTRS